MGKSQAEDYLAKAEKKASSSVGWFGSSSSKWEEAGDLFQSVRLTFPTCVWGPDFRPPMHSRWRSAGQSLGRRSSGQLTQLHHGGSELILREAACRQQANELNDAMNAFHNAAKSYKKSDPEGQPSVLQTRHGLTSSGRVGAASDDQAARAGGQFPASGGPGEGGQSPYGGRPRTPLISDWTNLRAGRV